jgi:uncharacterized metal-binding protein YceD (DUF177 family)
MNKSERPSTLWSVPVVAEDIPESGRHYQLTADAPARDGIARVAGLRAVPRLDAVFDLVRQGDRVVLSGHISARVEQTCVVSLEAVENDVEEDIDLVFAPPAHADNKKRRKKHQEPPEPLLGGIVDLGAVATEFLILELDPYPRKAGVEFAPPALKDSGPQPFAALAALKKRSGSDLK